MEIDKVWFWQKKWWELGNFIMATPMLKSLAEIRHKPINVFFDNKHIRELYEQCPFIRIRLKRPGGSPFATSCPPLDKIRKNESNSELYFRLYAKKFCYEKEMPDTYIDPINTIKLDKKPGKKYVAIFHGCLGRNKTFKKKTLPNEVRKYMIRSVVNKGFIPVILGSKPDRKTFWDKIDYQPLLGDLGIDYLKKQNPKPKIKLRDAASILRCCDYFISNDTGLYHVAGAIGLPGLVMWVKTNKNRNMSVAKNIMHIQNKENDASFFKMGIDIYIKDI